MLLNPSPRGSHIRLSYSAVQQKKKKEAAQIR